MARNRIVLRPQKTRSLPAALTPEASSGRSPFGRVVKHDPFADVQIDQIINRSWSLFRALRIRADAVSVPSVVAYGKDLENPSPLMSGGLVELLKKPNEWFSLSEIMSLIEFDLCTSTNGAFLLLDAFDDAGKPTQMWRVDPRNVEVVPGTKADPEDQWYVKHFKVYPPGKGGHKPASEEILPKNMIWIRIVDPFNELGNQSVVMPAIGPAMLTIKAMTANRSIHTNGITGSGIIRPVDGSMTWTDAQMDQIAAVITETLKGEESWHRWAIINRPDLKIESLEGMTPRDLQFSNLISAMDRAISQATGVPFPLIDPSDVILSNAKQARQILFSNTIAPELRRIASAFNRQLVDVFFADEAGHIMFDLSTVPELADDVSTKWAVDSQKLTAILQLSDKVLAGDLELKAAIDLAVSQIGITKEMARRVIKEPDIAAAEILGMVEEIAGPDTKLIEIAKAIVEGVYAGEIPQLPGQQLLNLTIGADSNIAVESAPVPPPSEPVLAEPAVASGEAESDRDLEKKKKKRPTTQKNPYSRSASGTGIENRGSPEHEAAWNEMADEANVTAGLISGANEEAIGRYIAGLSQALNDGATQRETIQRAVARHYVKFISEYIETTTPICYGRASAVTGVNNRSALPDFVASEIPVRVAAFAESLAAFGVTVAEEKSIQGAVDLPGRIRARAGLLATNLGFLTRNMRSISATLDTGQRADGVRPRNWRPLRWITQLDSRVRDTHADAHGELSEYDDGETGHAWSVGDGFCLAPGFCDDEDEEHNCRCFARPV